MIDLVRRVPRSSIALIGPAPDVSVSYGEMMDRVDTRAGEVRAAAGGRALALLAMTADVEAVLLYLACLAADVPLILTEPEPRILNRLVTTYAPSLLLLPGELEPPPGHAQHARAGGVGLWVRAAGAAAALHPDLALLLTTSGSTGSPKLVRLTRRNLSANAGSIARYLGLGPGERAITSLPLHYSYGLSVLNSHLIAGGSVALTPHSFVRPEFWAQFTGQGCTSLAGVPFMYETLHRLRFDPARHPGLRTLTQAGGGLRRELIQSFDESSRRAGVRFFVMYGQTEATARISYVPPQELPRKLGSIGVAIPEGRLSLSPTPERPDTMELVYEGPNVMMGYAESAADLARGDVQGGVLRTGDLGRVDEDGFFFLVGRLRRLAKLFGRRVNLEDVESDLESRFPVRVAALDGGDRLVLCLEPTAAVDPGDVGRYSSEMLGIPPGAVQVRSLAALPRTSSGKKDYRALEVAG